MDAPSIAIPMSAWEFILTWIPRICTCVGALVLLFWWRTGRFPSLTSQKEQKEKKAASEDGRRIDDKILDRVLTAQEKMADAVNNLADSWREQGRGVCEEMREQTKAIAAAIATGLRDVHGRIDVLVGQQKSHKGSHEAKATT